MTGGFRGVRSFGFVRARLRGFGAAQRGARAFPVARAVQAHSLHSERLHSLLERLGAFVTFVTLNRGA